MSFKETIRKDLIAHEGMILHAYKDHLGWLTIGVGRLIDERKGGRITEEEALYLLDNDIDRVSKRLNDRLPWMRLAPESVRRAMLNMGFQLGVHGLLKFRNMLAALQDEDYEAAAEHALDSLWAKQTPGRANEVANWIRNAE